MGRPNESAAVLYISGWDFADQALKHCTNLTMVMMLLMWQRIDENDSKLVRLAVNRMRLVISIAVVLS